MKTRPEQEEAHQQRYHRVEDPVVTEEDNGNGTGSSTVSRHPAYGLLAIRRQSGGRVFFASGQKKHHHFITLTVNRAQHKRNHTLDWYSTDQCDGPSEIVEISMSEAQWGQALSTMNVGDGVPCTIMTVAGEPQARLPPPPDSAESFRADLKKMMARSTSAAEALVSSLKETPVAGKKRQADLVAAAERIHEQMLDGMAFVASRFTEHMEETTAKSKTELASYAAALVHQMGLDAIASHRLTSAAPPPPKQLTKSVGPSTTDTPSSTL